MGLIKKILFPIPYFLFVYLKKLTCIITDNVSMRKTPHNIGNINSFLTRIAITAIIPPTDKLPVSPIKT